MVAAPCSQSWENMQGDDQVRYCQGCSQNVFNLSGMSRQQAERFLDEQSSGRCYRFFRRTDGTIITDNCPLGLRKVRDHYRRLCKMLASLAAIVLSAPSAFSLVVMVRRPPRESPRELMGDIAVPVEIPREQKKVTPTASGGATMGLPPPSRLSGENSGKVKLRASVNADYRALDFYTKAQENEKSGRYLVAETYYKQALHSLSRRADWKFKEMLQNDLKHLRTKMGQISSTTKPELAKGKP